VEGAGAAAVKAMAMVMVMAAVDAVVAAVEATV
jgi:hypothetical protein